MNELTLESLLSRIELLEGRISANTKVAYVSPLLNELGAALAKAQAEISVAGLKANNPYFKSKYADLAEIVKVSRPALAKNGLCVLQVLQENDLGFLLITRLQHLSGQYIESSVRIKPVKNDIQSLASYLTYMRRYSYASLVGVVAGNEDDDAEEAVAESRELRAKGTALNTNYNPSDEYVETITPEQLEQLTMALVDYPDLALEIMDGFKIRNLADMPKQKFIAALNRINNIIAMRKGIKKN